MKKLFLLIVTLFPVSTLFCVRPHRQESAHQRLQRLTMQHTNQATQTQTFIVQRAQQATQTQPAPVRTLVRQAPVTTPVNALQPVIMRRNNENDSWDTDNFSLSSDETSISQRTENRDNNAERIDSTFIPTVITRFLTDFQLPNTGTTGNNQ